MALPKPLWFAICGKSPSEGSSDDIFELLRLSEALQLPIYYRDGKSSDTWLRYFLVCTPLMISKYQLTWTKGHHHWTEESPKQVRSQLNRVKLALSL